ncbi:MAG: N2,N2-dimethylguanosine tRNA methyltransferase [Methanomassiliicoccus sp.]|nr:N2,N2-dimethylguanosine tRNA methyltransferase [Methanomassiliicoccus sp.]
MEGATELFVPALHSVKGPGKRTGAVFFNDQMAFNRDVTVMLLKAYPRARTALDAMASTGTRAVRVANEARPDMTIVANDRDPRACDYIRANAEHARADKVEVSNDDLRCVLARKVFDYVDIDPFGSPVHFIPSALQGLRRHGAAGFTATDTAPLAGTYPKKCQRRYGAFSMRSPFGHESGLRILIGHIAREAAKEDKGLECLLSFYADHYMRTYVRVREGGGEADRTLDRLGYIDYDPVTGERRASAERTSPRSIGPLWLGPLHDHDLLANMNAGENLQTRGRCAKYLELWRKELDVPFFYDNDELASMVRVSPRRLDAVFEALGAAGKVSRTHFSPTGIRTDLDLREVLDIYRSVKGS